MYVKKRSLACRVKWGTLVPTLFLVIACAPALVQADQFYAGVNYGVTKLKKGTFCDPRSVRNQFDAGSSCSFDDKDNGARLYGGYQFMDYAAVEFGYLDLGKYTTKMKGNVSGVPSALNEDFTAKGFDLALVGILPVTKEFSVIGRLGIFRWNVDRSTSLVTGGPFNTNIINDQDSKPGFYPNHIGIGLQYDVTKSVGVRVEWERFKDVGDTALSDSADIDLTSVGLVYKF